MDVVTEAQSGSRGGAHLWIKQRELVEEFHHFQRTTKPNTSSLEDKLQDPWELISAKANLIKSHNVYVQRHIYPHI